VSEKGKQTYALQLAANETFIHLDKTKNQNQKKNQNQSNSVIPMCINARKGSHGWIDPDPEQWQNGMDLSLCFCRLHKFTKLHQV